MTKPIEPRALQPAERALLDFLLSADFPGRGELKAQAESIEVVGMCECGCGTVTFAPNGSAARARCREPIPVEAQGKGLQVLLFVRDGLLRSLEIVDFENERPLAYPAPGDLKIYVTPIFGPTNYSGR